MKMMVIGMVAQTLKLTQKSLEKLRQTISLASARKKKKQAQRKVSFVQPSSSSWNGPSNRIFSSGLRNTNRPMNSAVPNRMLTMVGFILMKVSS